MSFAVAVDNRTPFSAATNVQPNADGQEVFVAMFAASFAVDEGSRTLDIAQDQLGLTLGDVPAGNPALSSIVHESDISPVKPQVDVIVNGNAYAPGGKPTREMQVGLRLGSINKVLNVVGDRLYVAGGYSGPHPFQSMPIVYERAFGGTTKDGASDTRNPVGVGYRHAASADLAVKTQAPNITYPNEPFLTPQDRPRPAGFGVIGRGWQPRIALAGTYDAAWLATQWPLPPTDFDPRYNLCSPQDQRLARVNGGEQVTVVGMTPEGRWDFRLPKVVAPIRLVYEGHIEEHSFQADTIVIEPELMRVTLKARLSLVTRRNAPPLREILIGHVRPALLTAKRKRKEYLSLRGGDGSLLAEPVWQP